MVQTLLEMAYTPEAIQDYGNIKSTHYKGVAHLALHLTTCSVTISQRIWDTFECID